MEGVEGYGHFQETFSMCFSRRGLLKTAQPSVPCMSTPARRPGDNTMDDNYFSRLRRSTSTTTSRRRGSSATCPGRTPWPSCAWPIRRHAGRCVASTDCRSSDRDRLLRRGRGDRAGRHPVADPPGAGRQEPADPRADRASTSTPASSGAWSRPSRCTASVSTSTPARTCRRSRSEPEAPRPKAPVTPLPTTSARHRRHRSATSSA